MVLSVTLCAYASVALRFRTTISSDFAAAGLGLRPAAMLHHSAQRQYAFVVQVVGGDEQ